MAEKTKKKKSAAVSAVASVTAAGILLSSLFTAPGELVKRNDRINAPVSITDTLIDNDDDDDDGDQEIGEEKRQSAKASIRKRFLMLPVTFRALLGVPVWCIGRIVMAILGAAWGSVLHPALLTALKYVCIAALILAAFLVTVKAVFPEMPVKKVLNKRNVFTVVIYTALFGMAGTVMQVFFPEGMKAYEIFESAVILAALSYAAVKVALISKKNKLNSSV